MAHCYLHVHGIPLMINGVYVRGLVKGSEIPVPVQTVKQSSMPNYCQNFCWNPVTPKAHSGGNGIKQRSQYGF